jgi:cytidyltransferase-like protein
MSREAPASVMVQRALALVGGATIVVLAGYGGAAAVSALRARAQTKEDSRLREQVESLKRELAAAQANERRLTTVSGIAAASAHSEKPVRIYCDGCFDMMHFGHSNALRQSKAVGDVLVVGLVSDADILKVPRFPGPLARCRPAAVPPGS